jgi:hypothetical protein
MRELSEVLSELERYCDDVTLSLHPSLKWRCYGELRIRVTGGSFEIKSEHGHGTPLAAAAQLLDRVENCLRGVHKVAADTALNSPREALEGR